MKSQSVSSLNLYNECPARYRFRYIDGIEPPENDTPSKQRGTLFHAGIEAALLAWLDIQKGAKTSVLIGAANGVSRKAREKGIHDADLIEAALALVLFYLPRLKIGTNFKPYVHQGVPVVEFPFEGVIDGVAFKGIVDAVVELPDGKLALVDWKTRDKPGNFYASNALMIDRQLYLYAACLEKLHGIKVDVITQIQMSAVLPATPELKDAPKKKGEEKKKRTGSLASDYSLVMGATTLPTLRHALRHLSAEEFEIAHQMYADKIFDDSHFLRSTRIDTKLVEPMFKLSLETARRINATTEFLPVLNGYTCKGCAWMTDCQRVYLGMGDDLASNLWDRISG